MANRIVPKHTLTASKVPLATDLVQYEIALNSADKILYFKDHNNNIQSLGSTGGGGDMSTSTYDTNSSGVVDNAEKLNGKSDTDFVLSAIVEW